MAWGGDGTMNEVGSALMAGPTPLAIIPSGSGNGLARELHVPLDPVKAIGAALRATPRVIDAGELGGRPFFNMAGIGFDAHIAERFDQTPGRGLATYVRVSARELLTYRSETYRIDAGNPERAALHESAGDPERAALHESAGDPEKVALHSETFRATRSGSPRRRALLVTFANSPQFGNGARIAPAARLDDGRLDLVVFEEVSRVATVWALPRLFGGGVAGIRGLSWQQIERATVESDTPMRFHVDGEPVQGGTVLEAHVLPGALRICA
jgi:diacylglycerol kinase family enzyme